MKGTTIYDAAEADDIPLAHLVDQWLDRQEQLLAAGARALSTVRAARCSAKNIKRILDVNIGDVSGHVSDIYTAARQRDGAKPRTINRELDALKQVLHMAEEEGYIDRVPRFRRPTVVTEDWDMPDKKDIIETLKPFKARHRIPMVFSMLTGLAWSEICQLQWQDVGAKFRFVRIGMRPGFKVKNEHRRRIVDLSNQAQRFITRATLPHKRRPTDKVFPAASQAAMVFAKARSIKDKVVLQPSLMRKAFASAAAEGGVAEVTLQRILGHSPGSEVTRQYYVRSSRKARQRAVERVGDYFAYRDRETLQEGEEDPII